MFKRFALFASPESIQDHFAIPDKPDLSPRYNIGPLKPITTILQDEKQTRSLRALRWGLVPHWIKGHESTVIFPNAESETVAEKPAFRVPFQRRRCLIPANGFYGWRQDGDKRHPYYFKMKNDGLMGFAGLWDTWEKPDGKIYETCTIITTGPNTMIQKISNRMPAIIKPESYQLWLGNITAKNLLLNLLKPYSPLEMTCHPVGTQVNSVNNDVPDCIAEI